MNNYFIRAAILAILGLGVPGPVTAEDAPRSKMRLIADFESDNFAGWTLEGTAFGSGPAPGGIGRQVGIVGFTGKGLANSFVEDDGGQGRLSSAPFVIEYSKIDFRLAGGNHPTETCMNLVIDGKVKRSATGSDDTTLRRYSWDVGEFIGRQATLEICDLHSGDWGWIAVDDIVQGSRQHVIASSVAHIKTDPEFQVTRFADSYYVNNPISLTTDNRGGIYVAEVGRWLQGAEDTRRRGFWIMDELAIESTQDRLDLYNKWIAAGKFDAGYFTRHEDRIVRLQDVDGNGQADARTVYADGFNEPLDGVGASILYGNGGLYYTNIPNLWSLPDSGADGVADRRVSLQDGFGLRIGVSGHDMHGLTWGPDGKIYWSIGDRGYNLQTADGRRLKDSESGAVFRCDADGSNLEVFCTGNRNPQDLAFDQFGNLFTVDNNQGNGDRSRVCYLVEGGDYGWQSGTTNQHNFGAVLGLSKLKGPRPPVPWNEEGMWKRQFPGQPAYLLPSVDFIDGGSAGLDFVPGLSLGEEYADHFLFSCCGRGVKSFAMIPDGASFQMGDYADFWSGGYALDTAFDHHGALYVADYGGASPGTKGDIYRATHSGADQELSVTSAAQLLSGGFDTRTEEELYADMAHRDLRVRREAQFELVKRDTGRKWLAKAATTVALPGAELPRKPGKISVVTHRVDGDFALLAMGPPSRMDYADSSRTTDAAMVFVAREGLALPHAQAGAVGRNLPRLNDGIAPKLADDPATNVWMDGRPARVVVALAASVKVEQIHTYTRHVGNRAPQRFKLWGSNMTLPDPLNPADWTKLAKVSTLPWGEGGIHGSVVRREGGTLGAFRFLMWDVPDASGMFLSEIDVYAEGDVCPRIAPITNQPLQWQDTVFDGNLLRRLHGIWGLGQLGRSDRDVINQLRPLLADRQAHVREQAAKVLGDLKAREAGAELVALLHDDSARARAFAATALGKSGYTEGIGALISLLHTIDNTDPYLRHAAVFGLEQMHVLNDLVTRYADDPSEAVRLGVLLLFRRAKDTRIIRYLDDPSPMVTAEAIRCIHDERMEELEPKLADHLRSFIDSTKADELSSNMNLHRLINANYRIGRKQNAQILLDLSASELFPEPIRVAAVFALARWQEPHPVDPIIGQLRAIPTGRENIQALLESVIVDRIEKSDGDLLSAYIATALAFDIPVEEQAARKQLLSPTASRELRLNALSALVKARPDQLVPILKRLVGDTDDILRAAALHALASHEPQSAERIADELTRQGTVRDAQTAYDVLGNLSTSKAAAMLLRDMNAFLEGSGRLGAALELVDACSKQEETLIQQAVSRYEGELQAADQLADFRLTLVGGDAERGEELVHKNGAAQCIVCHSVDGKGGVVGPDLAKMATRATPEYILESLVQPSAKIVPGYGNISLTLRDSSTQSGSLIEETVSEVILALPGDGRFVTKHSEIVSRTTAVSSMPPMNAILSKYQIRDVIAYLSKINSNLDANK